jgi:hypothetical protein
LPDEPFEPEWLPFPALLELPVPVEPEGPQLPPLDEPPGLPPLLLDDPCS